MGLIIRARGYEPLPTGEYRVELTSVKPMDGKYGDALKWVFRVVDDGRTLIGYTNHTDNVLSKCMEWVRALVRYPISVYEPIDLATLVGKTAIAYVRLKKRNNREYNRIEQLLPDWNPPLAG